MNNLPLERFLLGRKPLERIIPHHADLFDNPGGTLSREPVRIGPMRMGRFALLVALVVPLCAFFFTDKLDRDYVWLSIPGGLLLAAALLLLFRGIPMVLTRVGVTLVNGGTVTHVPWSVLNVAGAPYLSQFEIFLPIALGSADEVWMRRPNGRKTVGTSIHTLYLTVRKDKLSLINRTAMNSDDLVSLLTFLAQSLGAEADAVEVEPVEDLVLERTDSTVTLSTRNLRFPATCCCCLNETNDVLDVLARKRWEIILAFVTLFNHDPGHFTVSIPCCRRCTAQLRRRERRAALIGAVLGLIVAAGCAIPIWGDLDFIGRLGLSVTVAIFGPLIGYVIGELTAERRTSPVRLIGYNGRKDEVTIRFRNPRFVDQLESGVASRR